jgi:outer membrane lipoprotein LolB
MSVVLSPVMRLRLGWLLTLCMLLAGCASPPPRTVAATAEAEVEMVWQGRLSVKINSQPVQAWSAGFYLQGTPQQGSLRLTSPLGSVVAQLQWSPGHATLQNAEGVEQFDSLDAMVLRATGMQLPLDALFAWLRGQPMAVPGWEVELPQGQRRRLWARQTGQAPEAELRMVLE